MNMAVVGRTMLLSKIHRAIVTDADLDYIGSITIDSDLMAAVDLAEGQQVDVLNVTNGSRLTTYVITGPAASGTVTVNGAAAHHSRPGDIVIVVAYGLVDEAGVHDHRPKVVFLDRNNGIVSGAAELGTGTAS
ncbi:MAG: aspartate 1-decarboxylase [Bifidobacteriaceae bacterium]|jgi:aspartate 1-decarboxylase|nr:aspartate 1-decarboxylase [Bifidobacteriaceae bacterium]